MRKRWRKENDKKGKIPTNKVEKKEQERSRISER